MVLRSLEELSVYRSGGSVVAKAHQESLPCYTCVEDNELMLDPRSVYVSSGDRSGGAILQPGIQGSCQSTAETSIVSVK
jgi:hypothetical protein